ncbi:hypothetical protein PR202_ga13580 [Eleusine coracana subsp. coracana]|uniref:Uncharacterized protein n=1 Tax=Eleusine coracana subsp. coracana TaxID=191504 RepID=A0AAV5CF39_ELECO|nr:hypothetical protein PR202_ga13580 [Eleusine coracana subsp. coracana]
MGAAGAATAPPRHNPSPSQHRRRAASALSPAKSNGAANADARPKPKSKVVSSRYLLGPSSKSTSTSTTTTTTTSSSSKLDLDIGLHALPPLRVAAAQAVALRRPPAPGKQCRRRGGRGVQCGRHHHHHEEPLRGVPGPLLLLRDQQGEARHFPVACAAPGACSGRPHHAGEEAA